MTLPFRPPPYDSDMWEEAPPGSGRTRGPMTQIWKDWFNQLWNLNLSGGGGGGGQIFFNLNASAITFANTDKDKVYLVQQSGSPTFDVTIPSTVVPANPFFCTLIFQQGGILRVTFPSGSNFSMFETSSTGPGTFSKAFSFSDVAVTFMYGNNSSNTPSWFIQANPMSYQQANNGLMLVGTNQWRWETPTTTTATAGTATLPANPQGFIRLQVNGATNHVKIAIYNE